MVVNSRNWLRHRLHPTVQKLAGERINNLAVFIDDALIKVESGIQVKKGINWNVDCLWLIEAIICECANGSTQTRERIVGLFQSQM
jgi:hypothetical protein